MFAKARALTARIGNLFNAGAIADLTSVYVFPLPAQVGSDMVLFQTPAEFHDAMSTYRDRNIAQGLFPPIAQVIAVDLPRKGRFRVWVDWHYARTQNVTQNIYYCSVIRDRTMVEMVQYLRTAATGNLLQPPNRQRTA